MRDWPRRCATLKREPNSKQTQADFVIIDLDGPILDVRDRHCACYAEILRELGAEALAEERYWTMKRCGESPRAILSQSGADDRYDAFASRWLAAIESSEALALDHVHEGAVEALTRWRSSGKKLVLATMRHDARMLADQLSRLQLSRLFDEVLVCDPGGGASAKAGRVHDELPGECNAVWIGDTELDARAARLLGCPVVLVTCGLRDEAYLKSLAPDGLAGSLAAIPLDGCLRLLRR